MTKGPAYLLPCPDRLAARAVRPGPDPLLYGFDVERDLAPSFTFAEVVLLALTGREPDRARGRAFEASMTFLSAISVAEAPAHAAVLARICGAAPAPLVGTTAIAAAERAASVVAAHRDLIAWAQLGEGEPPAAYVSNAPEDERSRAALAAAIGDGAPACVAAPLSRTAALISVLVWCGLDSVERLVAALAVASLPASLAEGIEARPVSFNEYPLRLPEFEYREP